MSPAEAIHSFREPISAVVRAEGDGSTKAGIARAAAVFDLPPRRVRAALHNEVRAVLAHELDKVRRRYRKWLSDRRLFLACEIERLEQECRELEDHDL